MRDTSQQNATVFERITEPQVLAIEALMNGSSMTAAALAAGVDRTTVHRWRKDDAAFQSALATARRERWDELSALSLHLAVKAAAVIERALDDGDVKAALWILRGVLQLGQFDNRPPDDDGDIRPRGLIVVLADDDEEGEPT